jgi:hypothetical protein
VRFQEVTNDLFQLDAPLAIHLFNWAWWYDPQWEWAVLFPPDHDEWQRYNFPEDAQYIGTALDGQKLSSSWWTGGVSQSGQQGVPRFSRHWDGMKLCVSAMKERGYSWHVSDTAAPSLASATFFSATGSWMAQAETVPRATSMAALDALNNEAFIPSADMKWCEAILSIQRVSANIQDDHYQTWIEARGLKNIWSSHNQLNYIHETTAQIWAKECGDG